MYAFRRVAGLVPGVGFLNPMRWVRRIALVLVLLYGALNFGTVVLASRRDVGSRPGQAIVVMGAAQYNGRPSPVLRARLDHALRLYRRDMGKLIVVTGGRTPGDVATEASASANYLLAHGVPDARIAREVQGTDTYES